MKMAMWGNLMWPLETRPGASVNTVGWSIFSKEVGCISI
jgi:hypothetical protein